MLKASFQELANKVITSDLVNGAFKALNAGLQFLNTGFGSSAAQVALFSSAIFGLVSKISAMKILPIIIAQFRDFGAAISLAASEGVGLMGVLAGTGTSMLSVALPAITALVAGFVALRAVMKAIEEEKYQKSAEGIAEAISETDNKIAKLEADLQSYTDHKAELTDAEREYVKVLEAEIKALEDTREEQQKAMAEAAQREVLESITGKRTVYDEWGGYESESYNKAADAFDNLIRLNQEGKTRTVEYTDALKDYINTYQPLIDKLEKAGVSYEDMDDDVRAFYDSIQITKEELMSMGFVAEESAEDAEEVADSYSTLADSAREAGNAIEEFQNKMKGLTDYASPLEGYKQSFADLKAQYESGTLDYFEMKAAVEFFLPPEVIKSFGGDLKGAFDSLMSGGLGKILTSDNPLTEFNRQLVEMQENGTLVGATVTKTSSGISSDITNWDELAGAMGVTVDELKAIASYAQSTSTDLIIMSADLTDLQSKLSTTSFASMSDALKEVGTLLGSTDVDEIKAYVEKLQEIGAIEIDETEVAVDYSEVQEALDALNKVEGTPDVEKEVKVKYPTLTNAISSLQTLKGFDGGSVNYTVITTHIERDEDGNRWFPTSGGSGGDATGTEGSTDGLFMVNDGAPHRGSSAELIVSGDRAYIANGGKMGLTHLHSGDKVYTAQETQDILARGHFSESDLYGGVKLLADGTDPIHGISTPSPTPSVPTYTPPSVTPDKSVTDAQAKQKFEKWLKQRKHDLAMDLITEQEYYDELEEMMIKYLKDRKSLQDEYWKYEEELYKYRKEQLEDQIDLEEKLNALAKAKTQNVLVYKDGMFQYVQNTEAIARAQRDIDAYADGTTSASGGLALVGENGPEMRVLNNGDGIIPSSITRNLMRLGSAQFAGNANVGSTDIFNINTVKLEKINDVEGLFSGLKNLAMQKALSRA